MVVWVSVIVNVYVFDVKLVQILALYFIRSIAAE